jgi:hypothetical protein
LKTDIGISVSNEHDVDHDLMFRQLYLQPASPEMLSIVNGLFLRQLVETNE